MTREEAIKVLQREKDYVQQAIQKATDGDGYVSPDGLIRADDYVEACTEAISALRAQQEQEKNEALTLDELRKMDGKPVWVEFQDGSGGKWGIVHITMFNQIVFANGLHCTIGEPYYGKTWLAYRQKPEDDDHEKL